MDDGIFDLPEDRIFEFRMTRRRARYLLFGLSMLAACRHDRTAEIEEAMKRYDDAIIAHDVETLAGSYLPDGKLGGEGWNYIVSGDSIRKFSASFKDTQVLSNRSTTSSIETHGDSAIQKGTYVQVAVMQHRDTTEFTGKFEAVWKMSDGRWLLSRMYTSDYGNRKLNKVP